MTILSCNCDVEKACAMHADELYQSEETEMNNHVEPNFRDILNQMIKDAETDAGVRHAVKVLYGDDYLATRIREPSIPVTIDQLRGMVAVSMSNDFIAEEAGIRSYCDRCDKWSNGHGCDLC